MKTAFSAKPGRTGPHFTLFDVTFARRGPSGQKFKGFDTILKFIVAPGDRSSIEQDGDQEAF